MTVYAPVYSQQSLALLVRANRPRRKSAQEAIDHLCRHPVRQGYAQIPGADGRMWQVVSIDGVVVTYWIDEAVTEIRILAIDWVE